MIKVLSGHVDIRDGILTMDSCQVEVWREEGNNCRLTEQLVTEEIEKHFLDSGADFSIPGHWIKDCIFITKYFPHTLENK